MPTNEQIKDKHLDAIGYTSELASEQIAVKTKEGWSRAFLNQNCFDVISKIFQKYISTGFKK